MHRGELGPLAQRLRGPLADGRLSLAELRGAPVVLNFWASWCDPCRKEAPLLEASWRSARSDGVVFSETFFLSRDGRVVGLIREPQMRAGLKAAVTGRAVAPGRAGDRRVVR